MNLRENAFIQSSRKTNQDPDCCDLGCPLLSLCYHLHVTPGLGLSRVRTCTPPRPSGDSRSLSRFCCILSHPGGINRRVCLNLFLLFISAWIAVVRELCFSCILVQWEATRNALRNDINLTLRLPLRMINCRLLPTTDRLGCIQVWPTVSSCRAVLMSQWRLLL